MLIDILHKKIKWFFEVPYLYFFLVRNHYGFFEGVFLGNGKFPELYEKINEIANKYEVSKAGNVLP